MPQITANSTRVNLNVRRRLQFGMPRRPAKRPKRGIDDASSTGRPAAKLSGGCGNENKLASET
ncbi:hypothetical protein IFM47457_07742 [Aspergillus lentulus]|nr:hypothetical protein IFM47457_07742 [Aspergillus lentulus]